MQTRPARLSRFGRLRRGERRRTIFAKPAAELLNSTGLVMLAAIAYFPGSRASKISVSEHSTYGSAPRAAFGGWPDALAHSTSHSDRGRYCLDWWWHGDCRRRRDIVDVCAWCCVGWFGLWLLGSVSGGDVAAKCTSSIPRAIFISIPYF